MHLSLIQCLFRVERWATWLFMMKCTSFPFSFYPLGFYQRQAWGGQSHCIWPGQCALRLQLPPNQELPGLQGRCRRSRKVSFKDLGFLKGHSFRLSLHFHHDWNLCRKQTKSEMFCSFQCSYILSHLYLSITDKHVKAGNGSKRIHQ